MLEIKEKKKMSYEKKLFLDITCWIAFIVYMIIQITKMETTQDIFMYSLILFVFGGVTLIYLIVEPTFDMASKALVIKCDPNKAIKIANLVSKLDLFKNFKISVCILRLLAYIDLREYDRVFELCNEIENSELNKYYDLNVVIKHSKFIAYGEQNKKIEAKQAYNDFRNIKKDNIVIPKKKKININLFKKKPKEYAGDYYYNKNEVEAAYYYYLGNYNEAIRKLSSLPLVNYNQREKMHHYLMMIRLDLELNKKDDFIKDYQELMYYVGKNDVVKDYVDSLK